MIILCQAAFKEQIKKIGKIVTLYRRELLKERPSIGTFCTQSVFQGINGNKTLNFFPHPVRTPERILGSCRCVGLFGVNLIVGHIIVQTVRRQWVNDQLDAQLR